MNQNSTNVTTPTASPDTSDLKTQIKDVISGLAFICFVLLAFTTVIILFTHGFQEAWVGALYAATALAISTVAAWPIKFSKRETSTPDPKNGPRNEIFNEAPPKDTLTPSLPTKEEPATLYIGDQHIAVSINQAIDEAAAANWVDAEATLRRVESQITHFEPYDTSDAYRPMMWQSTIDSVRQYCAAKQETEQDSGKTENDTEEADERS